MGHSRSSAMSPFDRAHTISYSTLTQTPCFSCSLPFPRYGELFVESRRFSPRPTHLHLAPSLGMNPVEFYRDLSHQKKTDGRPQGHSIYCGITARNLKNERCYRKILPINPVCILVAVPLRRLPLPVVQQRQQHVHANRHKTVTTIFLDNISPEWSRRCIL